MGDLQLETSYSKNLTNVYRILYHLIAERIGRCFVCRKARTGKHLFDLGSSGQCALRPPKYQRRRQYLT